MKKTKSISEQVIELQAETERLQDLYKLFDKACKTEFGYDIKDIHKLLDKQIMYEQRVAERQGQKNQI